MLKTLLDATVTTLFIIGCAFTGCAIYDEYGSMLLGSTDNEYQFEKIANHVADDYTYTVNVFDCTEFSDELYNRLEYAGYKEVRIMSGCRTINDTSAIADFNNCHAWVVLTLGAEEIYIESTTGEIKSKAYFVENFPAWNHIRKPLLKTWK